MGVVDYQPTGAPTSSPPYSPKAAANRRSPATTGVSQSWISRLIARYTLDGDAVFEPRSRRPHTSPTRPPQATIDLIIALRTELTGKGLDAGPHTIAWHLKHHHYLQLSDSAGGMSLNPPGSGAR